MYIAQDNEAGKIEGRKEVTEQITKIAQDFEKKLFSTGGELALHKCYWYLIDWKWEEDGSATMCKMEETEGEMKLTKGYEVDTVTIQRLECTEAVRTIGVRICPSGQQQTEYRYRLHQTREFAKKLRGSRMSRSLAIRAYKTIYIPMIAYHLGAKDNSCLE